MGGGGGGVVKEGTHTLGLFDSVSGGLITKLENTRGQANWESGDSGIIVWEK